MSSSRGRVLAAVLSVLCLLAPVGVVVGLPSPATAQIGEPIPWFGSWQAVSAGRLHTCAIKQDDTLWCWGNNTFGQVGVNQTDPNHPVQVTGFADWSAVAAGYESTCGLRASGIRYCWGRNVDGELGLGHHSSYVASPTRVVGEDTWSSVDVGTRHACGIKSNGQPYCWGRNTKGQLGVGDTVTRAYPTQVGTDTWHSVSTGGAHTCGVRSDNVRFCWGDHDHGQLGLLGSSMRTTPGRPRGESVAWSTVVTGAAHTCGITQGQSLYCWGSAQFGQLGLGDSTSQNLPKLVQVGFTDVVAAGSSHTCRLANSVRSCTGHNWYGQLGLGDDNNRSVFWAIQPDKSWKALSGGQHHTCGMTTFSHLYCWGSNTKGQLGIGSNGPTESHHLPVLVPG